MKLAWGTILLFALASSLSPFQVDLNEAKSLEDVQTKPGSFAADNVLDRDPFAIPPAELHSLEVIATVFDGRIIFENLSRTSR